MEAVREALERHRIIVILRRVPTDLFLPTVHALYNGGIRLMEVTFDQESPAHMEETPKAIRQINEGFADIHVGAGTVLNTEQVEAAAKAGAKYIISPNVDEAVIRRTRQLGLLSMPGALTPTEIAQAYTLGADWVKVFPADSLGAAHITAVRGPLGHIPMLAVGGVNLANMEDFLNIGVDGFGIGGNIVNMKKVMAGDFTGLEVLARQYTDIIERVVRKGA